MVEEGEGELIAYQTASRLIFLSGGQRIVSFITRHEQASLGALGTFSYPGFGYSVSKNSVRTGGEESGGGGSIRQVVGGLNLYQRV